MATLSTLDVLVIVLYAIVICVIAFRFRSKKSSTSDYFMAGRSMPGWAVAMVMMAALISSNTFVGHPATVFQSGMILMLGSLTLPIILFYVARRIVPFYRQTVGMSAYEYLGARFGDGGRLYAAAAFVLDRTFDVGITLLTTAIPVCVVAGLPLETSLIPVTAAIALFTITYTVFGGMRAVVWTGIVQGAVFVIAALILIGRLIFAPECGPPGAVLIAAWHAGKFSPGSFELSHRTFFDPSLSTQWLLVIAYSVNWARRYITDQHMVQRYLIARSDQEASKGVFWNGLLCVPIWLVFMLIGAALYGYFALSGAPEPPTSDAVVPWFILHHLPSGVVGLMTAAILAASMSSISPDLNSIATVITVDFFGKFAPSLGEKRRIVVGRASVVMAGALALGTAVLMAPKGDAATIMERAVTVASILSGGMLGLFCLGFLTRRANRFGCIVGLTSCVIFTTWATLTGAGNRIYDVGINFPFHPLLIGIFGHIIVFVVGYVASLFAPSPPSEQKVFQTSTSTY